MTVVVDTNALLALLGREHPSGVIFDAYLAGKFAWAVSNEILLEYEEVVVERIGRTRFDRFAWLLESAAQIHRSLLRISPSFRFRLIAADPDDDKFADCAIAAGTDWIITSDHHFDAVIGSGYKPQPITPEEFIRRHLARA